MQVAVGGDGGEALVPQLDRQPGGRGRARRPRPGRPAAAGPSEPSSDSGSPTTRQLGAGLGGQRGDGAVVAGPVAGAGDHLVGRGHRRRRRWTAPRRSAWLPRSRPSALTSRLMPAAARTRVEGGVDAVGVLAAGHREQRVLAAAALDQLLGLLEELRRRRARCRA